MPDILVANVVTFRAAVGRMIAVILLVAGNAALAATYSLPGRIPSSPFNNCHFDSGTLYVCSGDLQIGSNNTINFTQDMTLKVTGNFKLSNNTNIYGGTHTVTVQADGNIELGNSFVGSVNFIAGQDFTAGNTAAITGNISAGGNITLGNSASVTGNVSTEGNLEVGSGTINGTCTYQTTNYTCSAVASLDHVRIEHSGAGITCLREPVTIKACQTSDCSTLYTSGSVSLTLSPSGAWYAAASGGTAVNTITFTGSTTRYFEKTTAGTVTLSATAISPSAPNGFKCYVGGVQNCSLAFADTGFIFAETANATAEATIPAQTAGTTSPRYWLRAVKTADTNKGKACEAALAGATAVTVSYSCNDPATCYTTNPPACGGGNGYFCLTPYSADGTTAQAAQPIAGGGTSVTMNFDSNGNAPFTFHYMDVGRITLGAFKAAGGSLVNPLSGSSNSFVVRPASFALTGIRCTTADAANCGAGALAMATAGDNPGAADAGGGTFIRAGHPFSVTVTARTSGGATAPSFGREATPEWVKLTSNLVGGLGLTANPSVDRTTVGSIAAGSASLTVASSAGYAVNDRIRVQGAGPSGGDLIASVSAVPSATTLTLGTTASTTVSAATVNYMFSAFANGVASGNNFTWSEVGIVTLTPSVGDGDYLGAGGVAGAASGNVGRFYPHHFDTEATHACVCLLPVVCDFTYSGQPFPLKVTARAAGGATTSNYAGTFAKTATLSDANGATGSFAPAALTWADFVGGVADKTTPPSVAFSYANPLTAPAVLGLRVIDSDDVSSASGAEGTTALRSGRARLSNANGSELLGLPLPLALQYYASPTLGWQTNTLDHCTTIAAANFAFAFPAGTANKANNLGACETAITVGGSAPNYTLTLAAPGAGNDGWADITLNLGATAAGNSCTAVGAANPAATTANAPWLRHNWSGTVDNPKARATFGVYKSGRIIHRREAY